MDGRDKRPLLLKPIRNGKMPLSSGHCGFPLSLVWLLSGSDGVFRRHEAALLAGRSLTPTLASPIPSEGLVVVFRPPCTREEHKFAGKPRLLAWPLATRREEQRVHR